MKHLQNFIIEGKQHKDTATLSDFYQWACAGEMPNGKGDKSIINPEDCEGLLDNGWFDNFDDEDPEKGCKEIAEFFKKNWDKQIKIVSKDVGNTWEVSFELDGKEYSADFINYFGGEFNE